MNGEISFMDWVGIGSIVTLICVLIKSYWDNEGIKERFNSLSKEQNNLKDAIEKLINDKHQILINGNGNLLTNLKSEREITTKETVSIKHDTKFIYDEILEERTSRRNLYQNVSNASEVLKTIDIMRETIVQNANLEVQNQQLFLKVNS
ncbi:TPA: hypothetical protein ACJ66C_001661, partial [Streptococcus pyogenes]